MTKPKTEEADKQAFMLALFNEYSQLSNGDKASIRRTVEPDDLQTNPVFYRLILQTIGSFKEPENKANARVFFDKNLVNLSRLVYFLPFIKHQANSKSLGTVLKEKNISERRLFLVMRSEYPEDLKHLRRLCQQFKEESVDGVKLSNQLFYWGKDKNSSELSKRQLMRDFYLSFDKKLEENTVA